MSSTPDGDPDLAAYAELADVSVLEELAHGGLAKVVPLWRHSKPQGGSLEPETTDDLPPAA